MDYLDPQAGTCQGGLLRLCDMSFCCFKSPRMLTQIHRLLVRCCRMVVWQSAEWWTRDINQCSACRQHIAL